MEHGVLGASRGHLCDSMAFLFLDHPVYNATGHAPSARSPRPATTKTPSGRAGPYFSNWVKAKPAGPGRHLGCLAGFYWAGPVFRQDLIDLGLWSVLRSGEWFGGNIWWKFRSGVNYTTPPLIWVMSTVNYDMLQWLLFVLWLRISALY